MNIYLDIDGVILTKEGKPAEHLKPFLKYITQNHDVYWLTTHCKGNAENTIRYLSYYLNEDILTLLKNVKATSFESEKTEAIDFDKDFLWFDDKVTDFEYDELELRDKVGKLVMVYLQKSPNFLSSVLIWFQDHDTKKHDVNTTKEEKVMVCNAYIFEILFQRYMLHIWTKPKFSFQIKRKTSHRKLLFFQDFNKHMQS